MTPALALAIHSPRVTAGRIQSSMFAKGRSGAVAAAACSAATMYWRPAETMT